VEFEEQEQRFLEMAIVGKLKFQVQAVE